MMTKEMMAKAVAAKKANPALGRPGLMKLTGCTNWDAVKFLRLHGAGMRPGQKRGDPVPKASTADEDVRAAAVKSAESAIEGGIHLSPATRVLGRKPPVTVRSKFYTLPKGKAFKIGDLSRQWGFSAETVKRHAKDEGCFAYIDVSGHDDFEECAMHPETAAARLKG